MGFVCFVEAIIALVAREFAVAGCSFVGEDGFGEGRDLPRLFLGVVIFFSMRPLYAMRKHCLVVSGGKRGLFSKILIRDRDCFAGGKLAPEAGLEPATRWLTASCSTIELLWKLKIGSDSNRDRGRRQDCFLNFFSVAGSLDRKRRFARFE